MATFDRDITYGGPQAQFASITGSPLWGLSVDEVVAERQKQGWTLNFAQRVHTPYGLGPRVHHFTAPNGREVIWIPSYGMVYGEEIPSLVRQRQLFWILWRSGTQVLLVGGTSGTNDWRDPYDEATIKPGDVVLPWNFDREGGAPMASYLPETGIGGLLPNLAQMQDPFCISLSVLLAEKLKELNFFRRVHRPQDVRVILRSPAGHSFETPAETMKWRYRGAEYSRLGEGTPYVFLHGDCVSPVLCRHLGIHEAYYHIPANWAEGHPATTLGLTEVLDDLYVKQLPHKMLAFENDVLQMMPIPTDCTCHELLRKRPDVYTTAMTNAE